MERVRGTILANDRCLLETAGLLEPFAYRAVSQIKNPYVHSAHGKTLFEKFLTGHHMCLIFEFWDEIIRKTQLHSSTVHTNSRLYQIRTQCEAA